MTDAIRPLIGWPLLPLPDDSGAIAYPTLEDSVRQTIRAMLSTRPGEQLMRPDFGAGIELFLHQPNDLATRRQIRDSIDNALKRWEARILVDSIEVWEVADEPMRVRVEIRYRLARTGAPAQMTLTVQLQG